MLLITALPSMAADKVRQWDCLEIALKCKTQKNPFTEVSLTATFTQTETGKSIR